MLGKDPDPVTGEYKILGPAPVAGEKVRLSAQAYNYSTAKSFKDSAAQLYAIRYDSNSNREEGERKLIGATTISLPPWTPTRGEHNLVATIEPIGAPSIIANHAGLMTESSLRRASLQIHVP